MTLAGFLGWVGMQTRVMGDKSTITTPLGSFVRDLTSYYFGDIAAAHGLAIAVIAAFYLARLRDSRRRRAAELPHRPQSEIILRTVLLAAYGSTVSGQESQPFRAWEEWLLRAAPTPALQRAFFAARCTP
ncbi:MULTISPECIES: hypothetical protein [unclassified Streptomyces]|uniref:hypothetical protein n=1 Tax=unclassified Streptomyces TaxID=2593676 RepID=UPI001F547801|nr:MULTISPECIES: hypothetical protein [unclassified Streptomyces]